MNFLATNKYITMVLELHRQHDCTECNHRLSRELLSHMVLLAPFLTIFLATPLSSAEADLWWPKFCCVRSLRSPLPRVCILGDIFWLHIKLCHKSLFFRKWVGGTIWTSSHTCNSLNAVDRSGEDCQQSFCSGVSCFLPPDKTPIIQTPG